MWQICNMCWVDLQVRGLRGLDSVRRTSDLRVFFIARTARRGEMPFLRGQQPSFRSGFHLVNVNSLHCWRNFGKLHLCLTKRGVCVDRSLPLWSG